jgi:hypothetical protein
LVLRTALRVKVQSYRAELCPVLVAGQEYENLREARDAAIAALPDIGREAPPQDGHRDFVAFVRDEHGLHRPSATANHPGSRENSVASDCVIWIGRDRVDHRGTS